MHTIYTMIFNALSLLMLFLSSTSARIGQQGEYAARRSLSILRADSSDKIPNQYIVRISSAASGAQRTPKATLLEALIQHNAQGKIIHEYTHELFFGFAVSGISESAIMDFAQTYPDDIVQIEEDAKVYAHVTTTDQWNL
jgi:hypothetical protein